MKKIDLGQTVTILANVGVIGGLIFVGIQLRQDREIAAIDSVQSVSDSMIASTQVLTQNADVDADDRDRWVREAALDVVTNPGLMKWWHRRIDRRALTDPNGSVWQTAVNMEIDRFESSGE